MGYSLNTKAIN